MLANHRRHLPYFFLLLLLGSSCDTARKTSLSPLSPEEEMGRNLGSRRRRKKAFHFLQRSLSLTFRPPDFCEHCSEKPLLRPLYSVCCPLSF